MTATVDADLARALRRTAAMRQCFYLVVLVVALVGQVTGAVATLHVHPLFAVPAVAALELGGTVVLANADVRRRLGERAVVSRVLSALIAAGAVAFNWLAHADHLAGGFYAGMSALGYLVWVTHAGNQRRDRLRAAGRLPPTAPVYEVWHWLRHPRLTLRARALAKADPSLDLYRSLEAARRQRLHERQHRAIAAILHRRIRRTVDADTADLAVAVYQLDRIAEVLADRADYARLTDLIGAGLDPAVLAPEAPAVSTVSAVSAVSAVSIMDRPPEAGPAPGGKVRVSATGTPEIHDRDNRPVTGVRAKSLELLACLAAHRDGAAAADIAAAIWPGTPAPQAIRRLSTHVSDLRAAIRGAGGPAEYDPVLYLGGRYRLNPAVVHVDGWHAR